VVRRRLLRDVLLQMQLLAVPVLHQMLRLVQVLDLLHKMLLQMVPMLLLAPSTVYGVVLGYHRLLLHVVHFAGS